MRVRGISLTFILLFTASAQATAQRSILDSRTSSTLGAELSLQEPVRAGRFFDVTGRRSAVFGYEGRSLEAWVYPVKILEDFEVTFDLTGYTKTIDGRDALTAIEVRPEGITFTYSHAAFTVRQKIYAPMDEPGIIMLFEAESVLPITVTISFRPRLSLAWPAGSMTPSVSFEEKDHAYEITEESQTFAAFVGCPGARNVALTPDQEEPSSTPVKFSFEMPATTTGNHIIPVVIAGSVTGLDSARATYRKLISSPRQLVENTARYYQTLIQDMVAIRTPDERIDDAFRWAETGIIKGLVTDPLLGTGLVAGYRTSAASERPGFAWFFGRDALWTSLALNSVGAFEPSRDALLFLKKFQRADGKVPHEISQSATLVPWFTSYEYPWASADATPLYVIAHDDYWRATRDSNFLKSNWESIVKAYRFSAASDSDKNGLIENTGIGHGWVEGGGLYPPHEEIYLQALWIQASRAMSEMAAAQHNGALASEAQGYAEKTMAAVEDTFWLEKPGFYAFATMVPPPKPPLADPGPNQAARQKRMEEIARERIVDEDTVFPSVALWWRELEDDRAQSEIDHLGSAAISTDWGARIISKDSLLYDPLSYHNGSVWPLFTG